MKKHRSTVSVRKDTYERVSAWCEERGWAKSELFEILFTGLLDGRIVIVQEEKDKAEARMAETAAPKVKVSHEALRERILESRMTPVTTSPADVLKTPIVVKTTVPATVSDPTPLPAAVASARRDGHTTLL